MPIDPRFEMGQAVRVKCRGRHYDAVVVASVPPMALPEAMLMKAKEEYAASLYYSKYGFRKPDVTKRYIVIRIVDGRRTVAFPKLSMMQPVTPSSLSEQLQALRELVLIKRQKHQKTLCSCTNFIDS